MKALILQFSSSTAFVDLRGNGNAVINRSLPLQTGNVVADTTPPQLVSFDFNMDNSTLPLYVVLHFDEIVKHSII